MQSLPTARKQWSQTEKTNKAAIHEQKLKCIYLAPVDGHDANGIPEEEEAGNESRMMDESVSSRCGSKGQTMRAEIPD